MKNACLDRSSVEQQKKLVSLAFGRAAHRYEKSAALAAYVGERMLERLEGVRLTPKTVLDLGANTGVFTRALKQRYRRADVVAVDIAEPMMRILRKKSRFWQRPHAVVADADALPFKEQTFDAIFANLVLPWMPDFSATLRALHRVMRPQGLILFSTYGPDTLAALRMAWEGIDTTPHTMDFYDMPVWAQALSQAGFTDPVLESESCTLLYDDAQALFEEIRNVGANNKNPRRKRGLQGKNAWRRFLDAFQNISQQDDAFLAKAEVLIGHAFAKTAQAPERAHETTISIDTLKVF